MSGQKGQQIIDRTFCFNITVNPDNSVTLKSWDKFKLISGGGKYYPEMEVYDLWYTFEEDGIQKENQRICIQRA